MIKSYPSLDTYITKFFHYLGAPVMSSFSFQWLVLSTLALTLLLLLLILFKGSRKVVVKTTSDLPQDHLVLADYLADQAGKGGDKDLQATINAYSLSMTSNTKAEFFMSIFAYVDTTLAPKYDKVKSETDKFKAELKRETGLDIDAIKQKASGSFKLKEPTSRT